MHTFVVRILLVLAAVTLVIPESYAKRVGGGRSTGRQAQITQPAPSAASRAQPAPPPAASTPVQRSQPEAARQSAPSAPAQELPRQASSPWGGMLGGALIGLGLGSLISGDRDPDTAAQSEGGNGTAGESASGSGDTQDNALQAVDQAQGNSLGSIVLLGILALVVFFLVRRARRRTTGKFSHGRHHPGHKPPL